MDIQTKSVKTLKVKKKIKPSTLSSNQSPRTLKVAKKLQKSTKNFPIPSSIQEDFFFDYDEHPSRFLSSASPNPEYELLVHKHRSLSPNDIVGPKGRFQIKTLLGPIPKSVIRHTLGLKKVAFRPPTPTLEQKIQERQKIFNEDYKKKVQTMDSVPDKVFYRQTRTLENYQKQVEYWNLIETNMSDKLSKEPEELQLNSARAYNAKQREVEIIDRLHKTNEVPERGYWRESLRNETEAEKFYKHVSPEVRFDNNLSNKYKTELLYYTKTSNSGRKGLRGSEYFQEKLKVYDKGVGEAKNCNDVDELIVNGVDKIKLEMDAARRVGKKNVVLPPLEMFNEEIIEKNYDSRVLPMN